jgi:hypothetical protein
MPRDKNDDLLASPSNTPTFKFLELTPCPSSQRTMTESNNPPVPKNSSTTFLELTPTPPQQSPATNNNILPKQKAKKSTNDKSSFAHSRHRIKPKSTFSHVPVFRTKKAASYFGVTMKKGEDEAQEMTEEDMEREEEGGTRERATSPNAMERSSS